MQKMKKNAKAAPKEKSRSVYAKAMGVSEKEMAMMDQRIVRKSESIILKDS